MRVVQGTSDKEPAPMIVEREIVSPRLDDWLGPVDLRRRATPGEQYCIGDDGLIAENVGAWVTKKHKRLTDYVQASGAARRKYQKPGAAFIDIFAGPGRARIRSTGQFVDGSAIASFKAGTKSLGAFTSIEISDARDDLMSASSQRLTSLQVPVRSTVGPATNAIKEIADRLNPDGLHFAFLDPHNLGTLSFSLFRELARMRHVDVLVHVSVGDLQRNADRYSSEDCDQFDEFNPGWRKRIGTDMSQKALRGEMIRDWSGQVEALGLPLAKHCELVTNSLDGRLYWLIFLARHKLAHKLWSAISSDANSPTFNF